MKRLISTIAAILIGASFLSAQDRETEIISLPKTAAALDTTLRLKLDRLAEAGGRIFIAAAPSDLGKIKASGLRFRNETWAFPPAFPAAAADSSNPIGAFHTGREIADAFAAFQSQYPDLARVVQIGLTLENRPILALKISDHPDAEEGEPAVLFLGCHHAREWISVEVPFLFGKTLLENYASDPGIRRLVDAAEIWIVPLVNPDGQDYSVQVYRYWRKNRRINDDGTYGVDINRNYGYAWGYDNIGSSPDPSAEDYRGAAAFSEPETQAIGNLILSRAFAAMISYHSYSQNIMYPWGYTIVPTAQDAVFADLALRLAGFIETVNGRVYLTGQAGGLLYLTNGDTLDWAYAATGMPGFTIELPPVDYLGGGFFNGEDDIVPIFSENLPAMVDLVEWAIAHPHPIPENPFDLSSLLRKKLGDPRSWLK
ncbi:MAG: M14 family metallopeptidase [Candidatus Aminicenantales bacterium]